MPVRRYQLLPHAKQVIRDRDFKMLAKLSAIGVHRTLLNWWRACPRPTKSSHYAIFPVPQAVAAFQYLIPTAQQRLLQRLANDEAAEMLNALPHDDLTLLLSELKAHESGEVLRLLAPQKRSTAKSLLEYPEDSAGRLMTPAYLAIRPDWTVQHTLDHVRAYGRDRETINALYVLDERGVLLDDIRISVLLLAPLTAHIAELMDRNFVALSVTDTKDTAVAVFRREDRTVLPVVEPDGRLVGIITADDVLDVADAAATEDIHKIGGMEASRRTLPPDFLCAHDSQAGGLAGAPFSG